MVKDWLEAIKAGSAIYALTLPPKAGEDDNSDQESDKEDQDQESNKDKPDQESEGDKQLEPHVRAVIKKANDEAAKYRTNLRKTEDTLKSVQAKLKEFEDKDKTEQQKAQETIAELQKQVSELSQKTGLANGIAAAVRFNAIDPDVVAKLVDSSSDETIDEQVKALVKSKPYLFKSNGDADGGKGKDRGKGQPTNQSMNDLIRGKR